MPSTRPRPKLAYMDKLCAKRSSRKNRSLTGAKFEHFSHRFLTPPTSVENPCHLDTAVINEANAFR